MRDHFHDPMDDLVSPPSLERDSTTGNDTSLQKLNDSSLPPMNARLIPSRVLAMQRSIGNYATRQYLQRRAQSATSQLTDYQGGAKSSAPSSSPVSTLQRAGEAASTKPKRKTPREQEQAKLEQYAGYVQQLVPLGVITEDDYKKFEERLHSPETEAGLTTFLEQQEVIKKNRVNYKEMQRQLGDAERAFRSAINQDIASKVNAKIDQVSEFTRQGIDESFANIADPLQKRIYFLIVMPKYFDGKSVDDVINHFKDVRKTTIPGMHGAFVLHDTVAKRLEMVAARMKELGMPMPNTSIGFGLRNRFNPDDLSSAGLMVHAMGIAIDFRATTNQHFIDPLKITLRDTLIGNTGRFRLPDIRQRRDPNSHVFGYQAMIKKMGAQMAAHGQLDEATARDAEAFFTQYDGEFARLSSSSHDLIVKAKRLGITDALQNGRKLLDQKVALQKQIADYQHQAKGLLKYEGRTIDGTTSKTDKAKIEKLQQLHAKMQQSAAELSMVETGITTIKALLPMIFAEWIAEIDHQSGAIEQRLPEFAQIPAVKNIMDGERDIAIFQAERATLAHTINNLRLPKMPVLNTGKLILESAGKEAQRVNSYSRHFQDQIKRLQYLNVAGTLNPTLENELQALENVRQTKGMPSHEMYKSDLENIRQARQALVSNLDGLSDADRRKFSKSELSKTELQMLQRNFKALLSKGAFDSAMLQQMQTYLAVVTQLQDVITKERQSYAQAVGGYKVAEAGRQSSRPEAQAAYAAKEDYVRYKRLKAVRDRLLTDEAFVFGTSSKLEAKDPSVWQMVTSGFFTPDDEKAGRESMTTEEWLDYIKQPHNETGDGERGPKADSRDGFNQNFMRLMVLYGFDQGSSWHSAQDSMHFELIELKEKIAKP